MLRPSSLAVLCAAAVVLVAGSPPAVADGEAGDSDATALSAAWSTGDCARCHEVPDQPDEPRVRSCHTCHTWIRAVSSKPEARARAIELFPHWERYEKNVRSYLEVPSLAAAMVRLEPGWVEGYLADPHDLRPRLPETMPRFALDDGTRRRLVDAFAAALVDVPETPAPAVANLARGEALFTSKGCVACHGFGARHPVAPLPMAPDLAHTRDRMHPDRVAAWIADPGAVSPAATMPPQQLALDEVLALRDYVMLADPQWTSAAAMTGLPQATKEPVTWAQVEERVFGRICVHCHMKPELNEGRAGPGNAGGFGWAATGIELQTREGVMAVADRIPDALLRRRHEAARDAVEPGQQPATVERPERPGMPLGLPPLSDEDTALVLGWIEQGMP